MQILSVGQLCKFALVYTKSAVFEDAPVSEQTVLVSPELRRYRDDYIPC